MAKVCTKCRGMKPLEEFSRKSATKDGLAFQCKGCLAESQRKYREENPEKDRERQRKYREKNLEKVREYRRRSRKENREKDREYQRKYHAENREISRAVSRKVTDRAQRITASMATKSGQWDEEETALLIELRKTNTYYQCAIHLGRSFGSVKKRGKVLRKQGIDI